jgi:hypothetical protein
MSVELQQDSLIPSASKRIKVGEIETLTPLIFEPDQIRISSVVALKLDFPEYNDEVFYAFLCSAKTAEEISFNFDEEGNMLVKHSSGRIVSLGDPYYGGLRGEHNLAGVKGKYFETKDAWGKTLGKGASAAKRSREIRLRFRNLFADPVLVEDNKSVVLTALYFREDVGFQIYKLVNTNRCQEGRRLGRKVLEMFE